VVVPIGGGGLISGIAIALKALSPDTRIIGVEVAASCPFTASLAAGRLVTIDVAPSLADGLTGNLDPDTITLDLVREHVDEIVVIEEDDLRRALAGVVTHEHRHRRRRGRQSAALLSGRVQARGNVAVILSGANIDLGVLLGVLAAVL
jgi:threonine dehydratase